jgi:hypothetical protein
VDIDATNRRDVLPAWLCPPAFHQTHTCRDDGAPATGALFLRVIDPSTGGGAGRRTDRFSDGLDALQIQETSSGRRPPVLFIQENAGGGDYFIGGGAGHACMNDLVAAGCEGGHAFGAWWSVPPPNHIEEKPHAKKAAGRLLRRDLEHAG